MKPAWITFLSLVTVISWGASTADALIRIVSNSSELQSALNAAVAGDEIILKDGIYTGQFVINRNSGSASSPIVVRAENRHKAILENTRSCADSASAQGLTASRSNWIISDLRIRKQQRAVHINASNVTFKHNVVEDFDEDGVRVQGASSVTVESNIIAYGTACARNRNSAGVYVTTNADWNTVRNNIIYATGNNGAQGHNNNGYGGLIADDSDNNLWQGNLMFANGGKTTFRILAGSAVGGANNNIVRDNAFLWGEGQSTDDCSEDSNQWLNNIFSGNFWQNMGTKGNKDGSKGHHVWRHNILHQTEFTRIGFVGGSAGCGGAKINNIMRDNVFFNTYQPVDSGHALVWLGDFNTELNSPGFNMFWAPGSSSGWFRNYEPQSSDILDQPIFVDASKGDFSLATGSPGRNAASDGTDIGVAYNSYLKKEHLSLAFDLDTQQNDNLSTGTSFTVSSSHFYQVYFFIPTSACSLTNEVFTVEGTQLIRDINRMVTSNWVSGTTQRWITLGRHRATDGTLNVRWTTSNCAEKIFIRKIPTTDEAYAWITGGVQSPSPSPTPSPTPSPSPYVSIPGRVELESFNTGGQGIAYHDTTSANLGGAYRINEAVDVKISADGSGYSVGYISTGEWLNYDVKVAQSGPYTITFRGANGATTSGNLHIEVDGVNVTGTISIPPTGSYQTETTVTGPTIFLTEGTRTLRVFMEASNFDLNWIEFTSNSPAQTPPASPSGLLITTQ